MIFGRKKAAPAEAERIIGYQYSATGVFGYEFFYGKNKICTVSSFVVPSPPVMTEGYGMKWKSGFDAESTLVPGLTRYVYDDAGDAQVASLVYKDRGEYEINKSITAHCGDGSYSFFRSGKAVAQINRYTGENAWTPESTEYDYEPYFEVLFQGETDDALKLLIFSFPMLRFGF